MNQHRTADAPDYEEDFYAWTQHQAKLLRVLGRIQVELPDGLDIAHVAEEIECLGSAELNAVRSLIRQILVHIIKAASAPNSRAMAHWRTEAGAFNADVIDRYAPSMRQSVDIQRLWTRALKNAELGLQEHGGSVASHIPAECPFAVSEIVDENFDFDAAVERLKQGR